MSSDGNKESETAQQLSGLQIGGKGKSPEQHPPQPPRPSQPSPQDEEEDDFEEEDENDPFADRNAVTTPKVERSEPTW